MLNQTIVMGRLVKDPEMRTTQAGKPVANFTIACDRDLQDQTDFFDCIACDKTAEFVQKHFFKGKMMLVSGSAQMRKYEDRNGNKRTAWEINVQRVYFADDKKRDGYAQMDGGPVQYASSRPQGDPFDDERVPF